MTIEALAMAVALGTDAFSVAMVFGTQRFHICKIIRLSLIIGVFHIFMPLIGYFGGNYIKGIIKNFAGVQGNIDYIFDFVGAGLLLLIGFYMIIESRLEDDNKLAAFSLAGWGILAVATSVSIDAFSIGISLGMIGFNISVVIIFGVVAALMMGSGLLLGSKIGHWLGDDAQICGGLGLIIIGLHFAGIF